MYHISITSKRTYALYNAYFVKLILRLSGFIILQHGPVLKM